MGKILTAREGYVYTNGETFASVIRLGINDSVLNWYEIPDEEVQTIEKSDIQNFSGGEF